MKNFFESDQYTEFATENGEIWVFGNEPKFIHEETPRQYLGRDNHWGDGTEKTIELPITDGHGTTEYVKGRVYVGYPSELASTTSEEKISKLYNFNV